METIHVLAAMAVCFFVLVLWWRRRQAARSANFTYVWWRGDVNDFRPEARHWAMCASAIYPVDACKYWDDFIYEPPKNDPDCESRGLREFWGIVDRESLVQQLYALLADGHRGNFHAMIRYYATLAESEADDLLSDIASDDDTDEAGRAEAVWRVDAARRNQDSIQSVNFLAWDLVRVINLCRKGASAGLIDQAEAEDFSLIACAQLQKEYGTWSECADHFLRARRFWQASDSPGAQSDQQEMVDAINALRSEPDSPWLFVSWHMDLPACRWLLVDALIDADLAPVLNEEDRACANEMSLAMDAVARDRMKGRARA